MSSRKNMLLLVVGSLLMIGGCAEIRKLTYPREITYIGQSELESAMQRMAVAMQRLDTLVGSGSIDDTGHRQVLGQLDAIDQIASELSGGTTPTNHLVLDEHIEEFIADVAKARLMAQASPPNYYYAGRLSGSCSGCHQFR